MEYVYTNCKTLIPESQILKILDNNGQYSIETISGGVYEIQEHQVNLLTAYKPVVVASRPGDFVFFVHEDVESYHGIEEMFIVPVVAWRMRSAVFGSERDLNAEPIFPDFFESFIDTGIIGLSMPGGEVIDRLGLTVYPSKEEFFEDSKMEIIKRRNGSGVAK